MDEIRISKKRFAIGLLLTLLAAAAGLSLALARRTAPDQAVGQPVAADAAAVTPDGDEQASQAALAGAQAFFTLDYQAGQAAWAERLCAVSSAAGCSMHRDVILPALWSGLETGQTITTAEVSAEEKVAQQTGPLGNVPMQVWRLNISLSAPWPVQNQPLTRFPALALVVRENGEWKFERFLSEEEAGAIQEKANQP
ncbi:MAG: hypothetical protein HY835_10795 [Anaerolineae bacterium]|nr:hypothetical protein [Anaerolineae bacterium]